MRKRENHSGVISSMEKLVVGSMHSGGRSVNGRSVMGNSGFCPAISFESSSCEKWLTYSLMFVELSLILFLYQLC